ncbi:hypothetical protein ACF1FX_10240 [Streptomyces sp. NPDC014646]|uniref:hypothetical protein n=1 Tax=Streptomyces sp. NPDC014646 TaxID=3364877 RepID=UPI0036FD0B12
MNAYEYSGVLNLPVLRLVIRNVKFGSKSAAVASRHRETGGKSIEREPYVPNT